MREKYLFGQDVLLFKEIRYSKGQNWICDLAALAFSTFWTKLPY